MSTSKLWFGLLLAGLAFFSVGACDFPAAHRAPKSLLADISQPANAPRSIVASPLAYTSLIEKESDPTLLQLASDRSPKKTPPQPSKSWEIAPKATTPTPPQPAPPVEVRKDLNHWIRLQRILGDRVWEAGIAYRTQLRKLQRLCNKEKAPAAQCKIYRLSQKIFSINYQTEPKNYRGYITFNRKRKHLIPSELMHKYRHLSRHRFYKSGGQCYIKQGLLSNCMTFAMCAQKKAMWNFRGTWGKGFGYPYWGRIQYLTSQAYYRHINDYKKNGQSRPGVRTLTKRLGTLELKDKKFFSRQLLLDIYETYRSMLRARRWSQKTRDQYKKAFCSNIVVNAGSFKRALPGDLFGLMYVYKKLHSPESHHRYHFQHWGLIVKPELNYVLHNQTPGGLWGRKFERWGIQFGRYSNLSSEFTWHRESRQYRKKIFVVHRLNLHYFVHARRKKTKVYNANKPELCRQWIHQHADLYFTDMSRRLPSTPNPPTFH